MSGVYITIVSVIYLGVLFYLAFVAEKYKSKNKSLIDNPYVYALSLAVYCTAWTFYGSVGRVKEKGLEFLSVYLGPTLVMLLAWSVLKKISRIARVNGITSIADFISARYGKYRSLGVWVTIISFLAGVPYIGLQVKAISKSFEVITGITSGNYFYQDASFFVVLILIVFTILFGTRRIQSNETHEGMIFAIAVESIFKLIAFLVVGIFITFFINDGWADVFKDHYFGKQIEKSFDFENSAGYGNWFIHIIISAFAFMFLPRQFQVSVVENQSEKNLKQAIWLFPLYLFLINIFVVFIAISGTSVFEFNTEVSTDSYVIALPRHFGSDLIALIAYIGGFSAATGMIIVETIAISTMITNSVILPFLLESTKFQEKFKFKLLNLATWLRRFAIVFIILTGYFYFRTVSNLFSLVSIGLIAFVAIAQFAPIFLGGIYWKGASKNGALAGLVSGFILWFLFLIFPTLIPEEINNNALLGFYSKIFGVIKIEGFDQISNAGFWSLLVNTLIFIFVSVFSEQSSSEAKQAVLFVDIFQYSSIEGPSGFWKGKAKSENLFELLASFIGRSAARKNMDEFAQRNEIDLQSNVADPKLVSYIENTLSGIVGTSSANMLVSTIAKEEVVSVEEVLTFLKRSQQILDDNEELKSKTEELERISSELKIANERLLKTDEQKNEFLTTVTHEIRTPLTSIKALTEIIFDNEDLEKEQKSHFLETIINETDRLSRLVNQVLDLEKYESGKHILKKVDISVKDLVENVKDRLEEIANEKNIKIKLLYLPETKDIKGDEDKLLQMLINVVSNAIKFVKPHEGEILITLNSSKKRTVFTIEDNGIGIPKDAQIRLFEKFYQVDNGSYTDVKGSGLGLSIVKKIVELHKGTIHLESVVNKGTKVMISLPIK